MKLKLFKKYFLTTSVIIIFSFTAILMILSFVLNAYISKSRSSTLERACEEVVEYVDNAKADDTPLDKKNFYRQLSTLSDVCEADVFIADNSGNIIICGCKEWYLEDSCEHSVVKILPSELEKKNGNENKLRLSRLGIYDVPHYVSAEKLFNKEGERFATVFATTPMVIVRQLLQSITRIFIFSAIIPIIIMFFAIYIITYRLTKPLKLMSEASKSMAKGDFSKRIPVMSDDEIGELSASFNMMTNSLARLEGMRKSFIANISHELKTPMTTIAGFIDGILDGTIETEKQEYYLKIVSDEVKRLSRLVQSMLSMARLESGEFTVKPELFDLGEMLFGIVLSQEQRIEKQKLEIIGLDEIKSVSVNADRDLIHQVIYNLVDNAVKFTDFEGSIRFSLKKEGKKTVFTITNTGKGIPEQDLPFVFERFYKVDKSRSASKNSTGLGLYIVKTIVTAHNGTITVTSRENEFTTFKVTIP